MPPLIALIVFFIAGWCAVFCLACLALVSIARWLDRHHHGLSEREIGAAIFPRSGLVQPAPQSWNLDPRSDKETQ